MLKDLPRYECLLECAKQFPDLNPSASELFMHLLQTADQLYAVKTDFLSQHGLSNGRFTVLLLLSVAKSCEDETADLSEPESLTPADLADRAGVTRATMTGLIDTLEKDGLVRREADPHDRRMMRVSLTEKAVEFTNEVLPGYFRRVATIMEPLEGEERDEMKRLLQKVREGIATASTVDESPAQTAKVF